jgi:hypothetical protein
LFAPVGSAAGSAVSLSQLELVTTTLPIQGGFTLSCKEGGDMIVSKLSLYLLSVCTFGILTLFAITSRSKVQTDLDPEEAMLPRKRKLNMKEFQDLQPGKL